MATYTSSFTLNASDDGALGNYSMYTDSTYSTNNGLNIGNLVDDMNSMQTGLQIFYGGTVSYQLSNGSTYLNATTVTWTIDNPTFIPAFIYFNTENYYYPLTFIATTECAGAYELVLTACEPNYTIPAGLTPFSNYYLSIETNRHKRYVQPVTTDGNGDVYLWSAAPEFPTGFFTPEMMTMTGKVYSDSQLTNQEQFTINSTSYNSVNILFIYTINVSD